MHKIKDNVPLNENSVLSSFPSSCTTEIIAVISKHGLYIHLYADDSQIHDVCCPYVSDVQNTVGHLTELH